MNAASSPIGDSATLARQYRQIRGQTEDLCRSLSPEDCAVQSMPDASPVKWHLAHTSWFFETFILKDAVPGYRRFDERYRVLFNSYYNAVGEQHPRPQRGLLTRPSLAQIYAYREHVDQQVLELIARGRIDGAGEILTLGLHHEQQHQELILMDIKHLFSCNPLFPAYGEQRGPHMQNAALAPLRWQRFEGGDWWIGHRGGGFAYDNEMPRHRVAGGAFELAGRLTTNGEFLEFIADDGYRRPELWLADGWMSVQTLGWRHPLYWHRIDDQWMEFTLHGLVGLEAEAPVCHLSYYEADAFARWSDARLPTEAEWEHAANGRAIGGNFVESGRLHPFPAATGPAEVQQLFGDAWEWTQSPYVAYPGFQTAPGAVGEYNGKFMCNQLVMRGGACVTPASHMRVSYRNFFYPAARWQFGGVRLARDRHR